MKNIKLLTAIGILLCLLCVTMAAADNENLPSREEVTDLLEDSDSASDVMKSVKEDHPTWKADLIENGDDEAIALYYEDSDSSKGYGSVYFKDGEVIAPSSLSGYTLKECYKGELEDSDECADGSCDTDADSDEEEESDEKCTDGSCNKDSESKDVSIASGSKLTVEERKASFMEFLENKDSITLEEVQDELDECFPDDMEA